jgi:hypothetical protein
MLFGRREQGYACITDPDRGVDESATFTCGHCNRIVRVKAKADPFELGGLCRVCNRLICSTCVGKGCDPLEEKIERVENDQDFRRWFKDAL